MPETSVGRLRIRREKEQIRVVIPVRVNARAFRDGFLPIALAILLLAGGLGVGEILVSKHTAWAGWSDLARVALGLILAEFVILFTARTIMTLTPEALMIESRLSNFKTKVESFLTEHLSDLHFVMWQNGVKVCNQRKQDEIQFMNKGIIHSFAAGISETEANALMTEMRTIYPFPPK